MGGGGAQHTVAIRGVPAQRPHMREETRRLITLIDELYEGRVALLLAAEGDPREVFAAAAAPHGGGGDGEGSGGGSVAAEAAAVGELRVACARAASRLLEVCGGGGGVGGGSGGGVRVPPRAAQMRSDCDRLAARPAHSRAAGGRVLR